MSENENDFEALRRLLALNRREVPPPGYFEDFSSRVIGRIRAAEAAPQMPWLLRLLHAFETKPAYPVAFASGLCTLLLFGIISVEQSPELVSNPALTGPMASFSIAPATGQSLASVVNTNPPADVALFGSPQGNNTYASPQMVNYSLDGNN